MRARTRRRALTLVEVAVLLVLLLTALGLAVLVIGRQREAGLRAQCANQLRRIGEAVQGYHDHVGAPGTLPASRVADGYATWAVQVAPYLLADHPLLAWDLSRPFADQPAAVRQAVLPGYFCPARGRTEWLSPAGGGAVGDYACVSGDGDPQHPWTGAQANGPIIFGAVVERKGDAILRWRGRTRLADLRRGVGYTAVAGEKHVPWGHFGEPAAGDGSIYDGADPAFAARAGGPAVGLAASPVAPFAANFGGGHRGVCQFVLADTSVRPLAVDADPALLGSLCRRGE